LGLGQVGFWAKTPVAITTYPNYQKVNFKMIEDNLQC
jgi:hypothetical protein